MNKIPMTSSGYSKLQDELKILVNTERPKIIEAIAEARSHGDLSENAEYQYAKEQQSLIEGKIIDLESAIANAEIIDVSKLSGNEVKFGATVKIQDQDSGETSTYQIVGEYESDVKNKKISVTSPIARALIGKKKQDLVEVNSPKGIKIYNIISVKFI
ncbi:MAG: Transcription elongation factor GreA [Alphaproteobacteria bacterium MarineAlpha5_Bin9]|nr:MAG: Transcription elongation factor GreA [Alphaproteobacteria bacterium MarineAlpha5_Bin9]|tara:strand:- start:1351 stop:1824 length:474 start_codon:yes stop_codon:yes gene_type:complete